MLMQGSTAIFIKYSCGGYKSFVIGNVQLYSVQQCTHSFVVDHIGCSICVYQSHIAIFS